ncbi:hypothetical protein GCM10009678_64970 [Actinomadura kijaniata]|uniref:Secreted protein n=1 Tax=Actinomadura namibiensis TaxID=182080 RepID=A0A7W3LYB1_ACTNM|nr:hypothetical protein [Actinomadura namibiensis]MBA8956422.1 hypothetical protein [Actinomadura namibiensis]
MIRTGLVGAGIAAATFGLASPALAADLSVNVGDGTIKYDDSADSFCAQAYNTEGQRIVEVKLVPVSQSGPSPTWQDKNNSYGHPGATCRSLATAYEDTRYRADVRTYWAERGTWVNRGSFYFYS